MMIDELFTAEIDINSQCSVRAQYGITMGIQSLATTTACYKFQHHLSIHNKSSGQQSAIQSIRVSIQHKQNKHKQSQKRSSHSSLVVSLLLHECVDGPQTPQTLPKQSSLSYTHTITPLAHTQCLQHEQFIDDQILSCLLVRLREDKMSVHAPVYSTLQYAPHSECLDVGCLY